MLKDTKQQWFKDAKYGLFIHWGLYSILAGEYKGKKTPNIGEWIMNHLDIPVKEYEKLAARFNPQKFNAGEIALMAKRWGMKYVAITAKHHDGFAMYHSKCNPYNVVDATPFKRDVVKELQLACKKQKLRFGVYYSQTQDWHDPDGFAAGKDNSKKDFGKYFERVCLPQVKELLTGYGELALIWFDTPLDMEEKYSRELYKLVKSVQPGCIVSGRIGNNVGDYLSTPDNFIPLLPYHGDWEVPATLNETWGYRKDDKNWKSPEEIINKLIKINGRGGNYLLNIGPDANGVVPPGSVKVLDKVAKFLKDNGNSIYDTRALDFYPYDMEWALFTRKDYKLFIHITAPTARTVINNLGNTVKKAYLLHSKKRVLFSQRKNGEGDGVLELFLPEEEKGKINIVICLELAEKDPLFEPLRHWEQKIN
jgi:alpha-L-fucosidase